MNSRPPKSISPRLVGQPRGWGKPDCTNLSDFKNKTCTRFLALVWQISAIAARNTRESSGEIEVKRICDRFLSVNSEWLLLKQIQERRKLPYSEFLNSIYWGQVKRVIISRDGRVCQRCFAHDLELHVHHKTYKNRGDELRHLEDLITLCHHCHEIVHQENDLLITKSVERSEIKHPYDNRQMPGETFGDFEIRKKRFGLQSHNEIGDMQ